MPVAARTTSSFFLLFVSCLGAMALSGCSGGPDGPGYTDATRAYDGPELKLGWSGDDHAVRLIAPTGGWTLRGDRIIDRRGAAAAYLTITRPAGDVQTQAIERHDIVLGVDRRDPLAIYARIVDPDEDPSLAPYRLVESALSPVPLD